MAKKKSKHKQVQKQNVRNHLKDMMKQRFDVMNLDVSNPDYDAKLKEIVENFLKNRTLDNKIKKLDNFDEREIFKTKSCYNKRRLTAALKYIPYYTKKLRDRHPTAYIEKTMLTMLDYPSGCLPDIMHAPDNRNIDYNDAIMAIALCMLDELYYSGNIHTAMLYIPAEIPSDSHVGVFKDFNDGIFENAVVEGLMYLIANRDNERDWCLNPTTVKRTEADVQPIIHIKSDKADIELKQSLGYDGYNRYIYNQAQNMSCRERLNKIIELIPEEAIAESQKAFTDELERYLDIVLKISTAINAQSKERYERLIELTYEIEAVKTKYAKLDDETRNQYQKAMNDLHKPSIITQTSAMVPDIDILMPNTNLHDDVISGISVISTIPACIADNISNLNALRKQHDKIVDEARELTDVIQRQDDAFSNFIACAVNSHEGFNDYILNDETLFDDLRHFHVANPFEICFAYFCLIEAGSDLPWLVEISAAILGFAVKQLPWTKYVSEDIKKQANEEQKNYQNNEIVIKTQDFIEGIENEYGANADVIVRRMMDASSKRTNCRNKESMMYESVYTDACEWYCNHYEKPENAKYRSLNFAQILFNMTGIAFPRNFNYDKNIKEGLIESGIKPENADLVSFVLTACNHMPYKVTLPSITDYVNEENTDDVADIDALKQELSDKKDEIIKLRKSIYDAEHKNRKLTEEINKLTEDTDAEHQELIALRELVYKLQNDENNNNDAENTNISFPYEPNQNIVIFGGHATWLKAIEPLLTNVRIIDPYTNPDANAIRNADIVWLQSNAMPHAYYNKIINITRQRKIPVQYFAYASAEKCARQLAEYDMGVNNNEDNSD